MKRKILIILICMFSIPFHAENWGHYSPQRMEQIKIERHIRYLKDKYPPDEWGWTYEISQSQKKQL